MFFVCNNVLLLNILKSFLFATHNRKVSIKLNHILLYFKVWYIHIFNKKSKNNSFINDNIFIIYYSDILLDNFIIYSINNILIIQSSI